MSGAPKTHGCGNALSCTRAIPLSKLACPDCWRLLPKPLQAAIYATWRTDRAAYSENVLQARVIWKDHHDKNKGNAP